MSSDHTGPHSKDRTTLLIPSWAALAPPYQHLPVGVTASKARPFDSHSLPISGIDPSRGCVGEELSQGGPGLGLRHVTSAEIEELDEDVGQEEEDTATPQAAECWGRTLGFPGSGSGGSVSQDASFYLQEKWRKLRGFRSSHLET